MILFLLPLQMLYPAKGGITYRSVSISYLNIYGRTNVNSFEFFLPNTQEEFARQHIDIDTSPARTMNLSFPVRKLKTENEAMYDDFLELLREKEYPEIAIGIDNTPLLESQEDFQTIEPVISIRMAGVTRRYKIRCEVEKNTFGKYIKGMVKIKLTDFNLEPPSKFLGLIKVRDEVRINFAILFST